MRLRQGKISRPRRMEIVSQNPALFQVVWVYTADTGSSVYMVLVGGKP